MANGYHSGELRAQELAGVREIARKREGIIRSELPEPAQLFLGQQRLVFLGTVDPAGRPWASVLTGDAGFLSVVDPRTVRIEAVPVAGDPLVDNLETSGLVGMLAMDPSRRLRVRVNGRLLGDRPGSILVRADQVYSNCPKYIQAREYERSDAAAEPAEPIRTRGLTASQREWIGGADTFFIATANPDEGADASHRGGMPGFVGVDGDRLTWPDYAGNSMFCTLGNIEAHPRAGLLFLDFDRGATLQITGRAAVDWDSRAAAAVPGAERLVVLEVEEAVEIASALPLRFHFLGYSPFNPGGKAGADGRR